MKTQLKFLTVIVFALLFAACKKEKEQELPNIVFILADDMGYGDVSSYGATKIQTPNIDRLANEGILFTDGHCGASTCTPTRYGLLTGRHNWRSWLKYSALSTSAPMLIEEGRMTVGSMLQQGLNIADVAYFIGEDTPKMTGVTDPALPLGYQFDYMNAEVIERDMTVVDGLITLPHGTQYKMMVLPKLETMRPKLLTKIKQLVKDGAVILGPAPSRSPSLQNQPQADQQVQAVAAELWGDVDGVKVKSRNYGKGMVLNGMDMKEALALINVVPDCKLPDNNLVHYGHRTLGDQEIYFLTNQTEETQVIAPEFRVSGKQPELWEATTGYSRALPAYEQKENVTIVPLKLAPSESVFVVFSKTAGKAKATDLAANYPKSEMISDFKTPWTVNFDASERGPEETVVFETLTDWASSADERIKHYSGTAFYNNTFEIDQLPENKKITIDLGALTAMAKVTVNGKYVGGVWTAPYRLDITDLVKQGENQLKIEVVNTWVNRVIGDMKLPKEERETWAPHLPYNAESPLQASGLFGPVEISTLNY